MSKAVGVFVAALAGGVGGAAAIPAAAQAGSPAGPVPVKFLEARRQALIAKLTGGIALIAGARELSNDPPDSGYPQASAFRQDNDFFYFTGLETRDSWLLVIGPDSGSSGGEVHLFLPVRDPSEERWTGPKLGPGPEAAQATGIPAGNIHPADSVEGYVRRLLTQSAQQGAPATLWFRRTERDSRPEFIRATPPRGRGLATRDLLPLLAELRSVKDADEIRRLSRAVAISAEGHKAAMRIAKPGSYEYELEAIAEYTFRRLGAERLGYPSIVGSGPNSTVLHYDQNRRQTRAGDLVVIDLGAEFGYYSADITRTIPVSGKFTRRQRAIYELVLAAQQAALDAVRPGVTLRALERIARKYLADHSGDLCRPSPSVPPPRPPSTPVDCGRYFIHELSHWIGMDVHDVGTSVPLVPGMAFTIEPGIYLPEESLGIRIEDDVLVTATGYELLSKGVPRTVAEIEKVMAARR